MTDRDIRKYIYRLNRGQGKESIFTRQISAFVDVAKVWHTQPKQKIYVQEPYRFFFIRNEDMKYIGAIFDMVGDLHWYVLPEHRKQGRLTVALKEVILPYIFFNEFEDEKENQRITVRSHEIGLENYVNSKKVALGAGFKPINEEETEFIISKDDIDIENIKFDESIGGFTTLERLKVLQQRVAYAHQILLKTSDELLMNFKDDSYLNEELDSIRGHVHKIRDFEWKYPMQFLDKKHQV